MWYNNKTIDMPTLPIVLSNNENAWGCSPRVQAVLQSNLHNLHRYPDSNYLALRSALSDFLSIASEQIILGNGSEYLIELIVKSLVTPKHNVILSQYAFQTIPLILKNHAATTKTIPLVNWQDDIDGILNQVDRDTALVFLVNPNNPAGTYTNQARFEYLLSALPSHVTLVVDEAYFEYVKQADYPNSLDYLNQYPNLICLRTFSKIYGLAGLRIGYAIASPFVIAQLNRMRLPFHVNAFASSAAITALEDQDFIQEVFRLTQAGCNQLTNQLDRLGLSYLPTHGNFVTIHVGNGKYYKDAFYQAGILVKWLEDYELTEYIRLSVGTQVQNELVLSIIAQILNNELMINYQV